jgi:hypothetical protein
MQLLQIDIHLCVCVSLSQSLAETLSFDRALYLEQRATNQSAETNTVLLDEEPTAVLTWNTVANLASCACILAAGDFAVGQWGGEIGRWRREAYLSGRCSSICGASICGAMVLVDLRGRRRSAGRRGLLLDLRRRQPVGLVLCRDGGATVAVSPSPSTTAAGVGVATGWRRRLVTTSEESGGGNLAEKWSIWPGRRGACYEAT